LTKESLFFALSERNFALNIESRNDPLISLQISYGVGVGVRHEQDGTVTTSSINVTAAFNAIKLPVTSTPLFTEMLVSAMMLPLKVLPDPSVAEELTTKTTSHAVATPLVFRTNTIGEPAAVVSVPDDGIWNTKGPGPTSSNTPDVSRKDEVNDAYTPVVNI
jgi:hypothetical protein